MKTFGVRRELFTMVELLVVIAIIGILAALLLPALKKAKDAANGTDCMGRLKQMALGMSAYTDDNNEWYPWANAPGSGTCFAVMDIYVFGKDNPGTMANKFYYCPSDHRGNVLVMSYAINGNYDGVSGVSDGIVNTKDNLTVGAVTYSERGCLTNKVEDTGGTFLFACYGRSGSNYNTYNTMSMPAPQSSTGVWLMGLFHDNATNWAFCDGHAAWMRWQESVGKGNQISPKGIWTKKKGD